MSQKKWKLKEEDYNFAYNYIMRILRDDSFFKHLGSVGSLHHETALDDLDILFNMYGYGGRIPLDALNLFIKNNFDDIQIRRLRVSLRVNKSLNKNPKKQISLDFKTHSNLQDYASKNGMTFSQAIDSLLSKQKKRDLLS